LSSRSIRDRRRKPPFALSAPSWPICCARSGSGIWTANSLASCRSAPYTAVAEARDHGYPVLQHIHRLVETEIIWAPAITGGFVLSTRGGDFDLQVGQDFSIGYLSHTDTRVRLYLQETFTFLLLTSEAAVALSAAAAAEAS
jgi:uncharacterized linocin/CFP29 family protein